MSTYLLWSFAVASTYNLTFLTIERYLAITKPMSYDAQKVFRRLPFVLALAWICGMVTIWGNIYSTYTVPDLCLFRVTYNPPWLGDVLPYYLAVMCVIIPTTIMTYAYIKMGLTLRKSRAFSAGPDGKMSAVAEKLKKAEVNIYQTCLCLMLLFVICWSNNIIAVALFLAGVLPNFSGTYYQTSVVFVILNACVNPYVYAIRYKEFQDQAKKLLGFGSKKEFPKPSAFMGSRSTVAGKDG